MVSDVHFESQNGTILTDMSNRYPSWVDILCFFDIPNKYVSVT
jgi:hypothetical protein